MVEVIFLAAGIMLSCLAVIIGDAGYVSAVLNILAGVNFGIALMYPAAKQGRVDQLQAMEAMGDAREARAKAIRDSERVLQIRREMDGERERTLAILAEAEQLSKHAASLEQKYGALAAGSPAPPPEGAHDATIPGHGDGVVIHNNTDQPIQVQMVEQKRYSFVQPLYPLDPEAT